MLLCTKIKYNNESSIVNSPYSEAVGGILTLLSTFLLIIYICVFRSSMTPVQCTVDGRLHWLAALAQLVSRLSC
jgi:hypothetical protein